MENNIEVILDKVYKDKGWSKSTEHPERLGEIKELIGQRHDWTSKRTYNYSLPSEINESYYVDDLQVTLYDNGIATLFWDKGNVDHSSANSGIGHFIETQDQINLRIISY